MNLKEYRKEHKLTQQQLADELSQFVEGINRPIISLMERGKINPNITIDDYLKNKACIHANNERNNENNTITPMSDKNRLKTKLEVFIFEALQDGPKYKRTLMDMANREEIQIRAAIRDMRSRGMWIIVDEEGRYKLTDDAQELETWLRSYLSRAYSELATANAMRNNNDGQMRW